MQIKMTEVRDVSAETLAQALAGSTPEYFAAFWLAFSRAASDEMLDKFAEAMAPDQGSNRRITFRRLNELIAFHEEQQKRDAGRDIG